MQGLVSLFTAEPQAFIAAMTVFGLLMGSFLNVVIYRLPLMLEREWRDECREILDLPAEVAEEGAVTPFNLVVPRSRCPACGHEIAVWENVPVLSFLALRGRCRACKTPIPWSYPLVELFTGLLAGGVAWHYGFGPQAFAACALGFALIALAAIDFRTQLLPDHITLPFLWVGIGLGIFGVFADLRSSVLGAMAGYLSLWTVYWAFKLLTGKEGMGYGDFKLLALLGAWCGWQSLPWIVLLSSLLGAVVGVSLIVTRRQDRTVPIPFGPYLAVAGLVTLLWGDRITVAYLTWAVSPAP
jgi:leader peptidase (prepilin peptidase)/N-methyltransferase